MMAANSVRSDAKKIVIIGGNACGLKTASRLRRRCPGYDITVVEQGRYLSYGACGFPYYVGDVIKDYRSLMGGAALRDEAYFRDVKGVRVRPLTEAVRIDREKKAVEILSAQSGERESLSYDTLVIATGGVPTLPDIEGVDGVQGVFTATTVDDAVAIKKHIEAHGVKSAVIAGGGFIGVEMAEGLVERGLDITLVKKGASFLPAMFDEEISLLIARHMTDNGVKIITGENVAQVLPDADGNLAGVVTESRRKVAAGLLLVTKGFRPNDRLARDAGLETGRTGIVVNTKMQTSDPAIYAGGDCVGCTDIISGNAMNLALGSLANIHGRIIADNIAGDDEVFPGVAGTGIFKMFNYTAGRTGLTEREAVKQGYDAVSVIVPGPDKPHYYPTATLIIIKLIGDRQTGRVLGAQVLGAGEVAKRVDIIATALTLGATADHLSKLNLAYSPPYAPALDNVIVAANVLKNKIACLGRGCSPIRVKEKMDRGDDFIYLDVRSPAEFKNMRIDHPSVMHLPLGKLRTDAETLPRDKEIIVGCMSSLRAYEAQRILEAKGFTDVVYMDGGLVAWPFEISRS